MNEFKRLAVATLNSLAGIGFAWRDEQAFRSQVIVLIVLTPAAVWLADSAFAFAMLVGSVLLIMTVELINTAIEAVVDRASPDIHPLAKKAKDCGSAAVLLTMVIAALLWVAMAVERFSLKG